MTGVVVLAVLIAGTGVLPVLLAYEGVRWLIRHTTEGRVQ